jgi:hypothetical protein
MGYQHLENLLIRYRNQAIAIKTVSGGVYEGVVADVTNDYVVIKEKSSAGETDTVVLLLHSIESILPRSN